MTIERIQVLNTTNRFSYIGRGSAPKLVNVHLEQGCQILRVPTRSVIKNLTLRGGASSLSPWGGLRGAVLKLDPGRKNPIHIDGKGFVIPTAHTLMDRGALEIVRRKKNGGRLIPHQVIDNIASERLYLVHSSCCHPDELFLEMGKYPRAEFKKGALPLVDGYSLMHLMTIEDVLYIDERLLDPTRDKDARTPPRRIEAIMVQLREGGHLVMRP